MTIISSRSRLIAAVSPLAIGMVMLVGTASSAQAQDVPATGASTADPNSQVAPVSDDNTIVVTGFRASLQNAINKKKKSDQIVESISAEDIGKLPDASIGEAIARLPGLAAQTLNGRAEYLSIRGFGPDFSTTLLNGREQVTVGDNRGVEYDQYPSEFFKTVDRT